MANINHYDDAPTYSEAKAGSVLSIVPVQRFAVKAVAEDGREYITLIAVFGTDKEDGDVGVFVEAQEEDLKRQLKIANKSIKAAVRAHLKAQKDVPVDAVPESLISGAIGAAE